MGWRRFVPSSKSAIAIRMTRRTALSLAVAGLALTSCARTTVNGVTVPRTTAGPTTTVPPTTTTTTEQPGWVPTTMVNGAIAIDSRAVTGPDGHVVTVFRFRAGQTRLALHAGSADPPIPPGSVGPDDGAAIGPSEAPALIAAFNGGFKASAGAGGFELDSQTIIPLQTGIASLVIDANGTARVGVWGDGVPAAGEQVSSVRQNLAPLVIDGQPSPTIGDLAAWGSTLGGVAAVARSSLGEDASGDMLYAAGMDTVPVDLADALISTGAVTAMELDINPEWVQLDVSPTPGGSPVAGIPGQSRPSDQYQLGWTRDFVTVLASHP
jgi:hypothetical protein